MAYIPDAFAEFDRAALRALVTAHNFGLLIASDNTGMQVVHLPFLLDPERGHHGHLRCHVARANPIWRIVDTARLLAVFTGPHAYISPNWYRTPDLVPTWNYAAVYADGRGRVMDEPELDAALYDLAAQEEARLAAANPWTLDRISPETHAAMRRAIVGIDIAITGLHGKRKMSQNRSAADRAGVVDALRALDGPDPLAVASLIDPP